MNETEQSFEPWIAEFVLRQSERGRLAEVHGEYGFNVHDGWLTIRWRLGVCDGLTLSVNLHVTQISQTLLHGLISLSGWDLSPVRHKDEPKVTRTLRGVVPLIFLVHEQHSGTLKASP